MRATPLIAILTLAIAHPLLAAEPAPEIKREAGTPQAVNALHTLRQIPEACARMEGMFTGNAAEPYKFALVRTSPNCQPRARFVEFAKAKPSEAGGWKFNDLIQVPSAACPSQKAVVRVWRKPADATPPELDAQGRSRLYLKEMQAAAKQGGYQPIPMFAAEMKLEGQACGG
ncbi:MULTISPECIES: hypothetical protein [unclassified Lysobacter]|uniref:hypothetical protein n=1 Tax=unclassified Lysobacter TaxID=2635362 RepID=UPI001F55D5EA|nr:MULTISPECIES: hypothetical protein [unclassified Lysobacter]